jgi:hypothetical protein
VRSNGRTVYYYFVRSNEASHNKREKIVEIKLDDICEIAFPHLNSFKKSDYTRWLEQNDEPHEFDSYLEENEELEF